MDDNKPDTASTVDAMEAQMSLYIQATPGTRPNPQSYTGSDDPESTKLHQMLTQYSTGRGSDPRGRPTDPALFDRLLSAYHPATPDIDTNFVQGAGTRLADDLRLITAGAAR